MIVPPPTPVPSSTGSDSRRTLWLAFVVAATLAYFFWTARLAPGEAPPIHGNESDHFNLLSRGFLKGHLYLDLEVPAGLREAPNPYDPAIRGKVTVLHDASYYQGRYYIYFGPAPVVTLLLPFRVLTGRDLPLPYAVWFFSSLGTVALIATFWFLQRRHFPQARLVTITAGLIALGGATLVVSLLRRAHIWELSAASGFAFFSLSLYAAVRTLHAPGAVKWPLLGGLALGLAIASRPTYLFCSMLYLLPIVRGWSDAAKRRAAVRSAAFAAAACAGPVLALLAYNAARFGHPLEFGMTYQLTSVIESQSRHFSLSYVPFNAYRYLIAPLDWQTVFPFVRSLDRPALPPGHGGLEYTYGLFMNLPFALLSIVALGLILGWSSRRTAADLRWTLSAVALAAALNAGLLFVFFGCCLRYLVDFAPAVMLLASIGALALADAATTRGRQRLLAVSAFVLAVFSGGVAAASVVYFYDPVPAVPPAAYRPVARFADAPGFWLRSLRWPESGPREIELTFPDDRRRREEVLLAVDTAPTRRAEVMVEYLDERKVRLGYREAPDYETRDHSPAFSAPRGSRHRLQLSVGGTYAEYDGLRGRLRAHVEDVPVWDVPVVSSGYYPGRLLVGPEVRPRSGGIDDRFSGVIHAVRAIELPPARPTQITGVRARLTLTPEMAGRAFPLVTSGRTKAGDLFFVRVQPDFSLRFGYDHWGDALLESPVVPPAAGPTRVIEFWLPTFQPHETTPALVVTVDGREVWRQPAAAYPVSAETIFLGSNPIGGSTCEEAVENVIFEDLQRPRPRAEPARE